METDVIADGSGGAAIKICSAAAAIAMMGSSASLVSPPLFLLKEASSLLSRSMVLQADTKEEKEDARVKQLCVA